MLELLSSLKEEQIINFRALNLKNSAEDVKTEAAIIRTQLNTVCYFKDLPAVIEQAKLELDAKAKKIEQMKVSQEPGGIN